MGSPGSHGRAVMIKRRAAWIFVFLFALSTAVAWGEGSEMENETAPPSPADMKVIEVIEILENWDLVEAMDMIKDLEYLTEDDQDEHFTE